MSGAESTAVFRGTVHDQRIRGQSPLQQKALEAFVRLKKAQNFVVSTPILSKYESGQQSKAAASQFPSLQMEASAPLQSLAHAYGCPCPCHRRTDRQIAV